MRPHNLTLTVKTGVYTRFSAVDRHHCYAPYYLQGAAVSYAGDGVRHCGAFRLKGGGVGGD